MVIFISNTQVIHCTYKSASANGVYVDNEATTCPYSMGWYVYRLNSTAPSNSTRFANGSQVKLLSKATHYQTGEKIPDNLKNKNYTVSGEKVVNQSSSVYAFLLKELYSWVLAQDLEAVSTGYPAKKVGETVTLLSSATHFQTGEKIDPSVKGKKYQIMQVKTVSQSKSKRAYLLAGIISWVLEQDVQ